MHFLEWKWWYFYSDFTKVCFWESSWQKNQHRLSWWLGAEYMPLPELMLINELHAVTWFQQDVTRTVVPVMATRVTCLVLYRWCQLWGEQGQPEQQSAGCGQCPVQLWDLRPPAWPVESRPSLTSASSCSGSRQVLRNYICHRWGHLGPSLLTHWGRDKMAAVSQTTFLKTFSWMKMYEFWLKFHWSLFLRVQLTIFHHWLR